MSEKTALELVDDMVLKVRNMYVELTVSRPIVAFLIEQAGDIKSAIERERDGYKRLIDTHYSIMEEQKLKLESAIVMRPIAELPDRVPDGCVIVAIRVDNTDVFVWRHCSDIKDIVAKNPFAGFYILPLPKPARRLHPCYMPGCGGDGKCVYDYSGSEDRSRKSWFVDCLKCHAQGPRCGSEQEAEQAWGYE